MPGIDGISFLKTVREAFPSMPFILFTGRGHEGTAIEALNSGADFYIRKNGDTETQFTELSKRLHAGIERSHLEGQVAHLHRLLSMKSQVNQALMRVNTREELLAIACRIGVDSGMFRAVWVAARNRETGAICCAASFGADEEFLNRLLRDTGGSPNDPWLTGQAVFKGKTAVCNDIENDPAVDPEIRPLALRLGYRAAAAFSVLVFGERIGALTLYAAEPGFFGQEAVKLLEGIAGDLSFALETFEEETQRQWMEKKLAESEEQFATLFEESPVGIMLLNSTGQILKTNRALGKMLEFSGERMRENGFSLFRHPDEQEIRENPERELLRETQDGSVLTRKCYRKDGTPLMCRISVSPVQGTDLKPRFFIAIVENVTGQVPSALPSPAPENAAATYLDNAASIIAVVDPDGIITYLNRAGCLFLGYSHEQVVGTAWFDHFVPAGIRDTIQEDFAKAVLLGDAEFDLPVTVTRYGKERMFTWHCTAIRDNQGQAKEIIFAAEETTERIRAGEILNRLEENDRTFIGNLPDICYTIDTTGNITSLNQAGLKAFEVTEGEILNKPISFSIHPEDVGMVLKEFHEIFEGRGPVGRCECRFVARQGRGKIVPALLSISAIYDASGRIAGIRGIARDLTGTWETGRALSEAILQLNGIIENFGEGICFTDESGAIVAWNRKAEEITGLSRDDATGRPLWVVTYQLMPDEKKTPDLFEKIRSELTGLLHHADAPLPAETREWNFRRADGSLRIAQSYVFVVRTGMGCRIGAVTRDITEVRHGEEALRQINRKMTLLNTITRHDILNRMTTLMGYFELARQETNDPVLLDYMSRQEFSIRSIYRQIDFMKDYQNIGIQEPKWQNIRETVRKAASHTELHGVSLSILCGEIEMYADQMLEKVFHNLIENAVRYGEKVTAIRFSCSESEQGLTLACEDDGVGIPVKDKEIIFRHGVGKNTGLGLFLAREILSITGLTILENGEPGKGARFEIHIPKGEYRFSSPG
jgi:PAS domain S-box-containing protein